MQNNVQHRTDYQLSWYSDERYLNECWSVDQQSAGPLIDGVSDTRRENPWTGLSRIHGVTAPSGPPTHILWVSSKKPWQDSKWRVVGGEAQSVGVFIATIASSSLGSKKRILYTSLTASLLQCPKQQIPRYVLGLLIVFVILFSFKRNFYFDVLEYFCSLCCTAMHYPPGSHPSLHHSLRNTFIIQTWFSFMKGFEALMFKAWTRRWIMKGIVFHHSLAATIAETTWSENFLEFK